MGLSDLMRGRQLSKPPEAPVKAAVTGVTVTMRTEMVHVVGGTYRLDKARADAKQVGERLAVMAGKRDLLQQQLDDAVLKRLEAQHNLNVYDKVLVLLQKTSEYAREQVKSRIEELVTTALNVVYARPYRFWMVLDIAAGKPVAEYWVDIEGVHVQLKPPDYGKGGGVIDVVTVALRLGIFELEQEQGPLFFDEVGKHIDKWAAPGLAYFLHEYGQKFNRQIVLITHSSQLAASSDLAVKLYQEKGRSYTTGKIEDDEGGADSEA